MSCGLLGCCLLGCSVVFVRPPPSGHEQLAYFDCVSSAAAPATDVTWALFDGFIAVGTAQDDPDTAGDESSPAATRVFTGLAVLSAASAVYGFIVTSHCDSA